MRRQDLKAVESRGPPAREVAMSAQNRALSRRWFTEVWNERRTATIDELLSPDGVGHMETGDLCGIEPFKRVRDEFVAAVPDLIFTIEGIVGDGDDVVVRWLATGTHSGEGLGIAPTQQPIAVRGMTWHRFKDGVMVEGWDSWNQEAFLQHLREGPDEQRARDQKNRQDLSARLRLIREEICGAHGGPEMARRLNIPARTWYNYETGVTVPADVLLAFLDNTGVDPHWLMTGDEPKYRCDNNISGLSPIELLRRGLEKLEEVSRDAGGGGNQPNTIAEPVVTR
jgi:predicted ester cyclase